MDIDNLTLSTHLEYLQHEVCLPCSRWLMFIMLTCSVKLEKLRADENRPYDDDNLHLQKSFQDSIEATQNMEDALHRHMAKLKNEVCVSFSLLHPRADVVCST